MKKLDISITKAALKSFSVSLDEGKPTVSATISLLTSGGKRITDYTVSSAAWNENDKFDLPHDAVFPIIEIAKILERVAAKHCRDSQKALPAPNEQVVNLDDIPF